MCLVRRSASHCGACNGPCPRAAPAWAATDWTSIIRAYDTLSEVAPSPIVALNRAIALAMRDGPAVGLEALAGLSQPLDHYHLFHATRADLRRRIGLDARADYRRALDLAENDDERRFLERRLAELGAE